MSTYETLLVECTDDVLLVTLNRPEKMNAINRRMIDEIRSVLSDHRCSPPGTMILTGAGEKCFAAGADIAELLERRAGDALANINGSLFDEVARFPAPTIAAIRGVALGGGLELALACDLRVCGRGSLLGQPEVSLGILPAAGATVRLPRLVGHALARELIFTGVRIPAQRAYEIGLVNRVVEDVQVLDEARALAASINRNSREAVRWAKAALDLQTDEGDGGFAKMAQSILFESEEKRRRMTAFLEKQKSRGA